MDLFMEDRCYTSEPKACSGVLLFNLVITKLCLFDPTLESCKQESLEAYIQGVGPSNRSYVVILFLGDKRIFWLCFVL